VDPYQQSFIGYSPRVLCLGSPFPRKGEKSLCICLFPIRKALSCLVCQEVLGALRSFTLYRGLLRLLLVPSPPPPTPLLQPQRRDNILLRPFSSFTSHPLSCPSLIPPFHCITSRPPASPRSFSDLSKMVRRPVGPTLNLFLRFLSDAPFFLDPFRIHASNRRHLVGVFP